MVADQHQTLLNERRAGVRAPTRGRFEGDIDGTVVDVCARGLGLSTAGRVPTPGSTLHLRMALGVRPFDVQARVCWSRPSGRFGVVLEGPGETASGRPLSDRICLLAQRRPGKSTVRWARTTPEHEAARRLVYTAYRQRGYILSNAAEQHVTAWTELSAARTVLLETRGTVSGTLTLVPDQPLGLPCEQVFADVVGSLRRGGRSLMEVTALTVDGDAQLFSSQCLSNFRRLQAAFFMFRSAFGEARRHGASDIIGLVHPRHLPLYRYLMFEPFEGLRLVPGVAWNPGVLVRLDIDRALAAVAGTPRGDFFAGGL